MLIVGNQIHYMMEKELGFDKEKVLSVDVYPIDNKYKKYTLVHKKYKKCYNVREM